MPHYPTLAFLVTEPLRDLVPASHYATQSDAVDGYCLYFFSVPKVFFK